MATANGVQDNHFELIIIGGGPAGRTVARMVKTARPAWRVLVVKEEEVNPNRCVIPYVFDDTVPPDQALIPNTLVTEVGAELLVGTTTELNAGGHRIVLNGRPYTYKNLVLATGAGPVLPPVPGSDLKGNFTVRDRSEMDALHNAVAGARRAAVVGMGLIGAEVAASMRRAGLQVTGIDMLPAVLGSVLDEDYAGAAGEALKSHGVELLLGAKVESVSGDNQVTGVVVEGREVPAEIVVWATGVKPRTELAAGAGAEVSAHGIVVDAGQRTSLPDVYAIGDCTQTNNMLTGKPHASKLGTTAVIQARVAAGRILGREPVFMGTLASWACQLYDMPLGGVGLCPSMLADSGFDVITADYQTMSMYPQMPHVQPVHARLYFERGSLRVLGAQLRGTPAMAGYLDLLALAIEQGLTAHDLARVQYATHPELAPRPSDNLIVHTALNAIKQK